MAGVTSGPRRPPRWPRTILGFAGLGAISAGCHPSTDRSTPTTQITWTSRATANISPPGDPRDDPFAFAASLEEIAAGPSWPSGYANLLRNASGVSVIGNVQPRDRLPNEPNGTAGPNLPNEPNGSAGPNSPNEPNGAADPLLADLLGTTIIDAQDELIRSGTAIRAHPASPELLATWAQAPPWPPEFVSQLIRRRLRHGDAPGPWVEALAAQIAPEPTSRAWLLSSWSRPRKPLDGALLGEIAAADGGALAREPRFRAWLRGEWRAWARQKYRLVERQAREGPR